MADTLFPSLLECPRVSSVPGIRHNKRCRDGKLKTVQQPQSVLAHATRVHARLHPEVQKRGRPSRMEAGFHRRQSSRMQGNIGWLQHANTGCQVKRSQLVLLIFSSFMAAGHGLQCYTTPDICETEKGYTGGCVEDVGVAVTCGPRDDACMSVLRATEPAYYFINKSCTSTCLQQDATKTTLSGRVVSETIDCCYTDLCNARNLPFLSAGSHTFPKSPWAGMLVSLGALAIQQCVARR